MSARRIGFVLLAASAVALALTGTAAAQNKVGAGIDIQLFRPAIDSKGFITLNASQTLGRKEFSFGIVTSYGRNVLVMKTDTNCVTASGTVPCQAKFAITDLITP